MEDLTLPEELFRFGPQKETCQVSLGTSDLLWNLPLERPSETRDSLDYKSRLTLSVPKEYPVTVLIPPPTTLPTHEVRIFFPSYRGLSKNEGGHPFFELT